MIRSLMLIGLLQVGARDSWFGTDKMKHFFLSAFVQSLSYSVMQVTTRGSRSYVCGTLYCWRRTTPARRLFTRA